MKYRKATLCAMIVLLALFLPITIFSTTKAIQKKLYVENPNHQFQFENKLYFYDAEDNTHLIGKYYCQTDMCDLAYSSVKKDDSIILKELNAPSMEIEMINNQFAFINDGFGTLAEPLYLLYNIAEEQALTTYKEIKNYNVGIENSFFIVKNEEDKYGAIMIQGSAQQRIPFEYDYLGIPSNPSFNQIALPSIGFASLKDNIWQIVSDSGANLSVPFTDPIYNYDPTYIILQNSNKEFYVTNYNGNLIINNYYKYLDFYNRFLVLIDRNNYFSMYDIQNNMETEKHLVSSIDDVTISVEGNNVLATIDGKVVETLAIN